MMLLTELIKEGRRTVSEAYPEAEAREMVSVFLEELLGVRKHTHILYPGYAVSVESVLEARQAFARMAAGEPLQYVMGKVLTQLHADAKPVEGIDVTYTINLGVYEGFNLSSCTHQLIYKVVGPAEFEFVEMKKL